MKNRLGGSMFIRNGIRYDYCFREALASLCAVCDEVVILDAGSDDGTIDVLKEIAANTVNLTLYTGATWECERPGYPGKDRLAVLANQAKDLLSPACNWHFMLQADEVIHEDSFPAIRKIVEEDDPAMLAVAVRRLNLYGDMNHHVRLGDMPAGFGKPCNDAPIRLARRQYVALGDAESLGGVPSHSDFNFDYVDRIITFHYGYVRNPIVEVNKVLDMQGWFGCGQDERIKRMKAESKPYDPFEIMPRECHEELRITHPSFSRQWVSQREGMLKW